MSDEPYILDGLTGERRPAPTMTPDQARVAELEAENKALRDENARFSDMLLDRISVKQFSGKPASKHPPPAPCLPSRDPRVAAHTVVEAKSSTQSEAGEAAGVSESCVRRKQQQPGRACAMERRMGNIQRRHP